MTPVCDTSPWELVSKGQERVGEQLRKCPACGLVACTRALRGTPRPMVLGLLHRNNRLLSPVGGILGCLCACMEMLARRRLQGGTEHHSYLPWWRRERRWCLKKPSPPSAADRPSRKSSCHHTGLGRVLFAALLSLPSTGRAKDGKAKGKGRTRVVRTVV